MEGGDAFGVGHDEGEAEGLEVVDGGGEGFGEGVGPEVEEEVFAADFDGETGVAVVSDFHKSGLVFAWRDRDSGKGSKEKAPKAKIQAPEKIQGPKPKS